MNKSRCKDPNLDVTQTFPVMCILRITEIQHVGNRNFSKACDIGLTTLLERVIYCIHKYTSPCRITHI